MIDRCLFLDLELDRAGRPREVGAAFRGQELRAFIDDPARLDELMEFAAGAELLVGHNLLGHDVPALRAVAADARLLTLPVIDTLWLSPLAFPENPYHHLVKDYKLVSTARNDPLHDAKLAAELFARECDELRGRYSPETLGLFRTCLAELEDGGGLAECLRTLGAEDVDVPAVFARLFADRVCAAASVDVVAETLAEQPEAVAYAAAWLRVCGGSSVLPAWVRARYPRVRRLLQRLRDIPCHECDYCAAAHDPVRQLRETFGFDEFRPEPAAADGGSLQERIVRAGMAERPLLAILPTGGGKSLCFQLPALLRHERRGVLTVVISPLQALMKDQVEGLERRTTTTGAATLNGLLTPPERSDVLERVRLGDTAILYVSPEQLRNRTFRRIVAQREIGCWVFDEAHCLSKWGHDFRPDYLYAGRFIRELAEKQRVEIPPVACFTATAKPDVEQEIVEYFERELGQRLELFAGGVERRNLEFTVERVAAAQKHLRIAELAAGTLDTGGSVVVYVATRREADDTADSLVREGLPAAAYHAGLSAPDRRAVQDRFLAGESRVICATNAFGMGIDKDDVRLVLHASVPGSLENYLQEAGRAGRDRAPARCVLLYDADDIEKQFGLGALGRLSRRDIAQVLRGIRRSPRDEDGRVVITAGELLRDDALELEMDPADRDAATRIATALAWLERAGIVERDENVTSVFQGAPKVANLEAAEQRLAEPDIPEPAVPTYRAVLSHLLAADPSEPLGVEDLAALPPFRAWVERQRAAGVERPDPGRHVLWTLNQMCGAGLLSNGVMLTAYVRHRVASSSKHRLQQIDAVERGMIDALREAAPDADSADDWQVLSLRVLNQRLLDAGVSSDPEALRKLLAGLSLDGRGIAGRKGSLLVRRDGLGRVRIKLQRSWDDIVETALRRQAVAEVVLAAMLERVPKRGDGEARVEFSMEDLTAALQRDLTLRGRLRDPFAAIERALMFMHEHRVITLQHGLAVFRQAMTVTPKPESARRRYTAGDYRPLELHYREQVFQVHVMDRYAILGADDVGKAAEFVRDYFALTRAEFARRYFKGEAATLRRATSRTSFQQIVESLHHPVQQAIVASSTQENALVLAGPGTGKTKVVVHRCAYLLRVERAPPASILVLCFNRGTAVELRTRLRALVGDDAGRVAVHTYHGLAARLSGRSFADRRIEDGELDALLTDATARLTGAVQLLGSEPDEQRETLCSGVRHVLVDEYQDIDERQYELVAALVGFNTAESDGTRPTLFAVGDDDQAIYAFRGAHVEFIRRFERDYDAKSHYLVENFRSTRHLIAASQLVIAGCGERMKRDEPIRIDQRRSDQAPGGIWQWRDPVGKGRVQVLSVGGRSEQAFAVLAEIERLRSLDPDAAWSSFAVLARTHEALAPLRSLCDDRDVPVDWQAGGELSIPIGRVREVRAWLDRVVGLDSVSANELDALRDELIAASGGRRRGDFWGYVDGLIAAWRAEFGEGSVPSRIAAWTFGEAIAEDRRARTLVDGLRVSTVHAAKGLEFDHVFVLDGGWPFEATDDERRLFYVALTRARDTACALRIGGGNPFVRALDGDAVVARRSEVPATELAERRYAIVGFRELFLDFAGRLPATDPIHARLAELRCGDEVRLVARGERVHVDSPGGPVAALSAEGVRQWRDRLEAIERVTVLAVVRRAAADLTTEFASRCAVETWEVPVLEVVWRER